MSKVRVSAFAVSLDGYAAGPNQSLDNPLGVRGPELFEWFFSTRTWKQMHGHEGGSTGLDNDWAQRAMENVGAVTGCAPRFTARGRGRRRLAVHGVAVSTRTSVSRTRTVPARP